MSGCFRSADYRLLMGDLVPTRGAAENGRQVAVVLERPDLPDSNDDAATAPAREVMEQSAVIAMASWITDSQKHMGAGQIEANGGQKRRSIFLDTTNRR
uniref:Uncharacterized protein n=1 Tax=Pyricularia oryzae (strain P131) TaxID=1143193 RepID=L7JKY8_PYRO1